eukprot:CAMPEP_0206238906 /NCGR_PEP_ID=MMETSP0047_2-20121206/15077_1 /ASSEMBLY_ACC=CAM_ASM_000192 /TAXON_ID=195065 /ORGANISM="Chroomonas mesostigmatica_cf, Strain CCMP1168" /LENGTH=151 /DNA_ID=CAMNT_0053663497 /DNA_START=339 /DNA_END=795 /DNA_ORIENTATION=+
MMRNRNEANAAEANQEEANRRFCFRHRQLAGVVVVVTAAASIAAINLSSAASSSPPRSLPSLLSLLLPPSSPLPELATDARTTAATAAAVVVVHCEPGPVRGDADGPDLHGPSPHQSPLADIHLIELDEHGVHGALHRLLWVDSTSSRRTP